MRTYVFSGFEKAASENGDGVSVGFDEFGEDLGEFALFFQGVYGTTTTSITAC